MNRREGQEPYAGVDRRKGERRSVPEQDYAGPERRVEPYPLADRVAWLAEIDRLLAPKPAGVDYTLPKRRLRRAVSVAASMASHPAGKGRP